MKKEAARLLAIFQKLLCIGASNWSKDRCNISFNQSDLLSQTCRDSFSLISSWELSSRSTFKLCIPAASAAHGQRKLWWELASSVFHETTKFWGQDAMKGSRKKFKILFCASAGSRVWTCYWYYERQLKNTLFQLEFDQTQEPCQKIFFEAKIWIEVSKVSKQLRDRQTAEDVAIYCKWSFYKEFI